MRMEFYYDGFEIEENFFQIIFMISQIFSKEIIWKRNIIKILIWERNSLFNFFKEGKWFENFQWALSHREVSFILKKLVVCGEITKLNCLVNIFNHLEICEGKQFQVLLRKNCLSSNFNSFRIRKIKLLAIIFYPQMIISLPYKWIKFGFLIIFNNRKIRNCSWRKKPNWTF